MHGSHDHSHSDGHQHGGPGGHSHAAGHSHAPKDFGRAFLIGITLNTLFIVIEAAYGYIANSMALIADAGHNLSDVLGLIVAWVAAILVKRPPSERYTYGLKSSSILAALANAVLLLVAVGAIALEAVKRVYAPEPVAEMTVMIVAAIGIVINGATALLFASGREHDLNIRGAYLHMAADAAVSAGVVLAALLMMSTGWLWLDPLISLVICVVIVWSAWGLLRESVVLSLDAVPNGVDAGAVRVYLGGRPGVVRLHDLHIWAMSTTEVALTVHLVMPAGHPGDDFLKETASDLHVRFGIEHVTVQIEIDPYTACALEPDHVV